MRGLIVRWVVNAIALYVTTRLVGGVHADSTEAILIAAAVLGIVNAVIRPIVLVLTFPFTIATLGIFIFIVNGLMLLLVSRWVSGFEVAGLGSAVWGALVLSIVSGIINFIVRD